MLQALLHGKLSRDHENIEDILTSNVFGLLKYGSPSVLAEALTYAKYFDDRPALEPIHERIEQAKIADWEFWPYWAEANCRPCEPDVAFQINVPGLAPSMVVIEAKLNAGKSSTADDNATPNDQLSREWDNLVNRARSIGCTPILVYLTSHFFMPREHIAASIAEYESKRGSIPAIAWLSWRRLYDVLVKRSHDSVNRDLCALLKRMGLTGFQGISKVNLRTFPWRYEEWRTAWSIPKSHIQWSYR